MRVRVRGASGEGGHKRVHFRLLDATPCADRRGGVSMGGEEAQE